jgi:hypothetical protein
MRIFQIDLFSSGFLQKLCLSRTRLALKIFLEVTVVIVYGEKCNLQSREWRSFPQRPFIFPPFGPNIFFSAPFFAPSTNILPIV